MTMMTTRTVSLLCCVMITVVSAGENNNQHRRRLRILQQEAMSPPVNMNMNEESFREEDWRQFLVEDQTLWSRLLSDSSMSMSSARSCVAPNVEEFVIDDNVNIGDVLFHPGPGFAEDCGKDCITVQDSGDDPPFDPEAGDTLRFAYKQVVGEAFSIQSRVCGTDCIGSDGFDGQYGRTGLMVRESLDPFSKNIFASHSPNGQADWSWRNVTGANTTFFGFDGSPDVPCLWITLERQGNDFTYSYAYESDTDPCGMEGELLEDLTQTYTIDMPTTVLVGLAVSTAVSPPFCRYTRADFRDITCRACS